MGHVRGDDGIQGNAIGDLSTQHLHKEVKRTGPRRPSLVLGLELWSYKRSAAQANLAPHIHPRVRGPCTRAQRSLVLFRSTFMNTAPAAMQQSTSILLCIVVLLATLCTGHARPARGLLQTAFTEADAASWVQANLTGSSPNVQAASTAVAQAATLATSSGSTSSSALASAFVNVLLNGNNVSGNATASAYSLALTQTKGNDNSQQIIAQAYSSAILSLYQANQVEVYFQTYLCLTTCLLVQAPQNCTSAALASIYHQHVEHKCRQASCLSLRLCSAVQSIPFQTALWLS